MYLSLHCHQRSSAYFCDLNQDNFALFAGITLSAAEILGIQHKVGSLEVGKEANLVVLEEDPLVVDKMRIRDIKIVNRVFRGAKC